MWDFLSANWLWILLIGGMVWMHLGHGGHGGHGGCGGHHQSGTQEHPAANIDELRSAPPPDRH